MKLMIDDMRVPEDPDVILARSFRAGLLLLSCNDFYWDIVYLDHDLGDPDPAKTGYEILKELLMLFPPKYCYCKVKEFILVTSNPVGRKNMENLLKDNHYVNSGGNVWTYKQKEQ